MSFANRLRVFFGLMGRWKPEWHESLSKSLNEAQRGLGVNMVVVIARESDLYAEILFLLSFFGLSLGAACAYLLKGTLSVDDLLILPMTGFALGATVYSFRRAYLFRIAPKAVNERVSSKAKMQFYEHLQHVKRQLTLLDFSEMESRAVFCTSPDIPDSLPREPIDQILGKLSQDYDAADPLKALTPALLELGEYLRRHLGTMEGGIVQQVAPSPIYVGATDRNMTRIPLLKGNKDIN